MAVYLTSITTLCSLDISLTLFYPQYNNLTVLFTHTICMYLNQQLFAPKLIYVTQALGNWGYITPHIEGIYAVFLMFSCEKDFVFLLNVVPIYSAFHSLSPFLNFRMNLNFQHIIVIMFTCS